ncbi:MAG: adenosine kinase [Bacteroidales bacterium]|jgi:sugar/nucleoside kinase (ribokinase family)|nr:adenosine kinase [Bacteroidales bacterium]
MIKSSKSVLGIGSALVDILARLDSDQLLTDFGLPKGSMTLVDARLSHRLADAVRQLAPTMQTGGSAANTTRVIGQLKGRAGFIGQTGDDDMGRFFRSEFEKLHISTHLSIDALPTGVAVTLITPDSERTFGTYLGAASTLSPDSIRQELFTGYDCLHLEGYLVFNHTLIETILKRAKDARLKTALDLASYNVVAENRDFLARLIDEYIDIVFANEEEAKALTGVAPAEAVRLIGNSCETAVVKIGREGSLVCAADRLTHIDTPQVADVVDTTGAGDVYAGGFLYGLATGCDVAVCGQLGSLLAAEVIQVQGARVPDERVSAIYEQMFVND